MSNSSYLSLNKEEKCIVLQDIFCFLKSFCKTQTDFSTLLHDLQENKLMQTQIFTIKNICNNEEKTIQMKKRKVLEKKQVKRKLEWDDLSPNVIIYNVLPYRLMKAGEMKSEFDCFGYFKRDKLRNIWYLFNSLYISCLKDEDEFGDCIPDVHSGIVLTSFYYCVERLIYFECDNFFEKYRGCFDFKNLEGFYVYTEFESFDFKDVGSESIMKNNKFNKLKELKIRNGGFELPRNQDILVNINLKGIERFSIFHFQSMPVIFNTFDLKHLELDHVRIKMFKSWGELKNVEELKISSYNYDLTNFFNYHKFEKLKKFSLSNSMYYAETKYTLDQVKVSWNHLKKIRISNLYHFSDMFFQNNLFNSLESINLTYLPLITGTNWRALNNLKNFEIEYCNKFESGFFLRNEFKKNVEKIICQKCDKITPTGTKCKVFEEKFDEIINKSEFELLTNLKKLIVSCYNDVFSRYNKCRDNITQNIPSNFHGLKYLHINDVLYKDISDLKKILIIIRGTSSKIESNNISLYKSTIDSLKRLK